MGPGARGTPTQHGIFWLYPLGVMGAQTETRKLGRTGDLLHGPRLPGRFGHLQASATLTRRPDCSSPHIYPFGCPQRRDDKIQQFIAPDALGKYNYSVGERMEAVEMHS